MQITWSIGHNSLGERSQQLGWAVTAASIVFVAEEKSQYANHLHALQGWPSGAPMGQTSTNGSDGAGFSSSAGGQQAGYSTAQDSFAQTGGYPQQAAFGAFSPQQAAMATPQVSRSDPG